jgi:uncharacterized membrane protein
MRIHGKSMGYLWEKYGGVAMAIIVSFAIVLLNPTGVDWKSFVLGFPSVGMCAFGFLLTLLGIILQGSGETIEWMKNRTTLFNRFVDFNKRAAYISFILSVYSYIIGNIALQDFCPQSVQKDSSLCIIISIGSFCGLLAWFIVDVLQFIRLFYVLIREKK